MEEKITSNYNRVGNFTSSQIWKLMTNGKAAGTLGKPALTYIQEKNFERKLGQLLDADTHSKPTTWGNLCEEFAFQQLGMEYRLQSQSTYTHPDYDCWKGSADCIKFTESYQAVVDIKCPYTRKSFCLFNEIQNADELRNDHPDGEAYYWQLVSNAIINNCTHAELVVFMPYQSELDAIRDLCQQIGTVDDMHRYFWIANSRDSDLPYLIDGGYYKHLHIISFEVPESDKQALTDRVAMCCPMLTL
jgi:hypothetical protein